MVQQMDTLLTFFKTKHTKNQEQAKIWAQLCVASLMLGACIMSLF